ncbi:MAG TPA: Ig-like domain-containing protein [Gammaproteobacteria bacterium]|nr:Ig-like domain-containing protein [Gammaproteobacteria bacterium]
MRTPRAFSVWWMGLIVGCAAVLMASRAFAQPIARNDSFTTTQGTSISVADANGVLVNDSAAAGGPLDAVLVTLASNGLLLFPSPGGGGFFYLPNAGFTGNDTFTYQARESGTTLSNVATVTISVVPPNVAPVAADDGYATNEDQTLNVAASGVLANDTDANGNPLTAVLVTDVATGTLTLQANGSFSYVPSPGFSGPVTFTYQASDGTLGSNTATVTITVNAVDDPPVTQPDSYTTAEDTPLSVGGSGVLGNDSDPEGTVLTAQLVRDVPSGHVLQLNDAGSFVYTPQPNFNGTATFTYRAGDGANQSGATTVTITVTPVNDPPFRSNAPDETATEGVTYKYTLAALDPDGTTPTISAPTLPSWLTFTPPATISGTPGDDDVGAHDVTMSVTDGIAAAVSVQFRITVEDVDIPPSIAAIPEQTATEGTPFDLDLTSFVRDDDTPAGSLTYAHTSGLPAGLSLSAAGRISGTPQLGASGAHTVRFTVADAANTGARAPAGQFRLVVLPAGRVDLAVAISASPNPITLDTPTTWTLTVTNRAPQVQAPGASLAATFAGQVPFLFDPPPPTSGCTVAPSGDQTNVSCAIGPLAGGASATITLTGRSGFAGDVLARASVTPGAGALDENSSNDTAIASLSVAQRVAGNPAQRIAFADSRAVAAGDLNADGFDDLAVATGSAQGVVVFTNVADPTNPGRRAFATPPQSLGGEALTTDIAIADLDRDGDLDIVTAAANGAPSRAFLSAAGTFTSTALGLADVESRAVAVGDVNGDAFLDLVFANAGMSSVLLGTGSGATFTAGPAVGPHDARDVVLVDLLGDSLPELVLATNGDDGAAVYRNTRGTFTFETTLATGPTSAVATGDFNKDNRADVVFARDTATLPGVPVPSTLVMLNTSSANGPLFVSDRLGAALTTRLLVHDFDLDSSSDVLTLSDYGARIYTNENGTFALHPQQLATPAARGVAAGKFSSDERLDLAVVGDSVAIFINDGSGNFGQPDSNAPVIALRGDATVNLQIDSPYADAGATATDQEDGDITSRIVVANTVNTRLLGTYTITYNVSDLSGNAAKPVTRTVNVQPQAAALEGGGGGALGLEMLLALLLVAAFAMPRSRGLRPVRTRAETDDPKRPST